MLKNLFTTRWLKFAVGGLALVNTPTPFWARHLAICQKEGDLLFCFPMNCEVSAPVDDGLPDVFSEADLLDLTLARPELNQFVRSDDCSDDCDCGEAD
jgi:hypothetical protein